MEIKLKDVIHLYLGCDVQTKIRVETSEGEPLKKLKGKLIDIDLFIKDKVGIHLDNEKHELDTTSLLISDIKLILIPLCELMDEVKPEEARIEKIVRETLNHCDAYDEWMEFYIDNPEPSRILQAPFEVVQELIKQQYDVFNLIPSGQVIDKSKF